MSRYQSNNLLGIGLMSLAMLLFEVMGVVAKLLVSAEMSAIQAIAVRSWFITALVWATIIGYLVWRDIPPHEVWLGAAIIIGCDLYVIQRESLRRKSPALAPEHFHPLP